MDFSDAHRPANDLTAWRVRRKRTNHPGSENVFFATEEAAYRAARKAKRDGTLVFFGEYRIVRTINL
jgi:hypothetical protein